MPSGFELTSKVPFSAEEIYRTFYEFSSEAMLILDGDTGHILDANDRGCLLLAYSLEELKRLSLDDLRLPDPAALPGEKNIKVTAAAQGIPQRLEWRLHNGHGKVFWAEIKLEPAQRIGDHVVIAHLQSIDARKRLEEVVRSITRGSAALSGQALFDAMTRQLNRMLGADIALIGSLDRETGRRVRTLSLCVDGRISENMEYSPEFSADAAVCPSSAAEALFPGELYLRQQRIEGRIGIPLCDSQNGTRGVIACFFRAPVADPGFAESVMDVAAVRINAEMERTAAEARSDTSSVRYRLIFENIGEAVLVLDRGTIVECNRRAPALFGLSDQRELAGRKIETLAPLFQRDGQRSGEALQRRLRAAAEGQPQHFEWAFHRADGGIFFAECSLSLFKSGEQAGLVALLKDATARRRENERAFRSHEKLQRSVESIISAITTLIEARDPYTAGHQRRVAKLACALADEMGLPAENVSAIRMAAVIHDIGKMYVPAEILSKPDTLSDLEFNVVKIYPQASYDILKNIEFPWPIAEIVRQHQERWDGTGYPSGLIGEATLIEARIIGVADVVEAMTFRRPYRPANGITKALEELRTFRGVRYDPAVADACLRLFEEKGFALE